MPGWRPKRDSKRRWKARFMMGKPIPREAIENHSLGVLVMSLGREDYDSCYFRRVE